MLIQDELFTLTKWCADKDMDLTFIEVMPMGDIGNENRLDQYWSLKDLEQEISKKFTIINLKEKTGGSSSVYKIKRDKSKNWTDHTIKS